MAEGTAKQSAFIDGYNELHKALQALAAPYFEEIAHNKRQDDFIALPGGPGTMEEWFEVYTWAQVGYVDHPIALLNINNYYQPLLTYLDHAVAEGFLHQQYRNMVIIDADPQTLLDKIIAYQPDYKKKW